MNRFCFRCLKPSPTEGFVLLPGMASMVCADCATHISMEREQERQARKAAKDVRDTSLAAHEQIKGDGTLAAQESVLVRLMVPGDTYSLQELSKLSGIAINAVSGRVNGLKHKGVLVEADKRACRITGRTIRPVTRKD